MHAILLAGQPNQGLLKNVAKVPYEADIPVGERAMGAWIVDALKNSVAITSIGLVGPTSLVQDGVTLAPMVGDMFGNILSGLTTVPEHAEHVLFITSDIPWITGPMIQAFIDMAPPEFDVVYPIITKEVTQARFPGTKRTYVRLKEGVFTGGNLFVARPGAIPRLKERAEVLLSHRKSPIKLAQDVGWGLLFRLVFGQLSIRQAEDRVGDILGIRGKAIVFPYAEAGVDVDKPEDLALAHRELGMLPEEASGQGWERV